MKEKKSACYLEDSLKAVENGLSVEDWAGAVADDKADAPGNNAQRYTKQQLAASARFGDRRDLVSALLEEGSRYTVEETDRMVREFMKGKVE